MELQRIEAGDVHPYLTVGGSRLTEILQIFVAQLFSHLALVEKEFEIPEVRRGLEKEEEFLCRAFREWMKMLGQDDSRESFDELLTLVKEQRKYEKRATILVENSWKLVVSYQLTIAGLIYARNNYDPQRVREHLQRAALCCEAAGVHGIQESLQLLMMMLFGE
jgi:hypothetical protein